MLTVEVPDRLLPERRYALSVVLGHHLGVSHRVEVVGPTRQATVIRDDAGRSVRVADDLFARPEALWGSSALVPTGELAVAALAPELAGRLATSELPVLFGRPAPNDGPGEPVELGIDVFGSAFFLLSRYEEWASTRRDEHDRFVFAGSTADRYGLVNEPLVDQYVEVLWWYLERAWPRLERRRWAFEVVPTHDVDNAFAFGGRPWRSLAPALAGAAARRRPREVLDRARQWAAVRREGIDADPYNTFRTIMDVTEGGGAASAFYFIPDATRVGRSPRGRYTLDDAPVRRLMAEVASRGHEIGIHASYPAHDEPERLASELATLRRACQDLGLPSLVRGGRHHYLRWAAPRSWRTWSDAGLDYDSTVGFAERPGFRAGTCRPYPVYDLDGRAQLPLVERPLILMDVSVTGYAGHDARSEEAAELVLSLRRRCQQVGGEFVVLWHNDVLARPGELDLFRLALTGTT
ncbi:MAG: hypothetical protein GEV08_10570 [Acidimicrobiia bacterium]|nr:hypothetical protein [Acidimicrobiia bacterium]